jgi:hypothetical protein
MCGVSVRAKEDWEMKWPLTRRIQIALRIALINLGHTWKKLVIILIVTSVGIHLCLDFPLPQLLYLYSLISFFILWSIFITAYGVTLRLVQNGFAKISIEDNVVTFCQTKRKIVCDISSVTIDPSLAKYRVVRIPGGLIAVESEGFDKLAT